MLVTAFLNQARCEIELGASFCVDCCAWAHPTYRRTLPLAADGAAKAVPIAISIARHAVKIATDGPVCLRTEHVWTRKDIGGLELSATSVPIIPLATISAAPTSAECVAGVIFMMYRLALMHSYHTCYVADG